MTNDPENNDNLKDVLKTYGLKQDIRRIHAEMMPVVKRQAPVRSLFTYANRIAAAILIVIFSAAIFVYFTSTPSALFKSRYEPYEQSAQRGEPAASSDIQSIFLKGQASLQQGDAVKAAEYFSDIMRINAQSNTKVLNDDAEYYLGLSYLKAQQPGNALRIFLNIRNLKNHLYNDKISDWFLIRVKIAAWKEK
jgi:hypothetical protein